MALSQLTSSDVGASARDKINQAIAEADKVGSLAAALAAALAALQISLAPYLDLVGGAPDRPGDARTLFTSVMTGNPKSRPAIDKGTIQDGGELGQVLRISGVDADPVAGYIDIAPRRAYYMRPGRAYLVQHAFGRFQDPTDPLQHAVELRFQNLSSTFGIVSNVRLGDVYAPVSANGSYFVDTFVGKAGAPGFLNYTVPKTAAYGVPFFRVYGNGHQTDLAIARLYDVTDALAGGADIASILSRVAKLESLVAIAQSSGFVLRPQWPGTDPNTSLSAVTPVLNTIGEVPDTDTGAHAGISTEAGYVAATGLVPNAGRYAPTGTPVAWRRVSDTTAKLSAAALIAGAVVKTTIGDTEYVMFTGADKKSINLIAYAAFKDSFMEKKIFKPARGSVPAGGALWASPDPTRSSGRFINTGAVGNILIGVDAMPVANTENTVVIGPGQTADLGYESGSIYMATDSGSAIPVYGGFTNQTGYDAHGDAVAYAYLSRLTGNQTDAERTIIANFIKKLSSGDIMRHLRMMFLLANTDTTSARVDVVRTTERIILPAAAPVWTKYHGYKGDATAAYYDANYVPKDDPQFLLASHGFGVYVENEVNTSTTRNSMGNQTTSLLANRNGQGMHARSGFSPGSDITDVGSYGGLYAVARSQADRYTAIHNQDSFEKLTATGSSLGSTSVSMLGLAANNSSGVAGGFSIETQSLIYACDGGMSVAQHKLIGTAMAELKAAFATLGA